MSSPVKNLGDTLKVLLSSCVPYLQLNFDIVYLKEQCAKLDTYSDVVLLHELISGHSVH